MGRIVYIRHTESGEVKLGVRIEGELFRFTLGESFLSSLAPLAVGDEIDENTQGAIRAEDEERRCMKKALALLAYADNSKRALYMKLRRAGYSSRTAEACAESCKELGYIREDEQLLRLVGSEANIHLRGRRRIVAKLSSRGYAASDIEAAIERLLDTGEVDFDANFARLLEKLGDGTAETEYTLKYKYGYK